mgnify:CR=1 FL=1
MSVLACCFIVVVSLFLVLVVAFDFLIFIMQRERGREKKNASLQNKNNKQQQKQETGVLYPSSPVNLILRPPGTPNVSTEFFLPWYRVTADIYSCSVSRFFFLLLFVSAFLCSF